MTNLNIPTEIIGRVRSLYDRCAYLQAYLAAIDYAPLADWNDTTARILAGRIAMQVGGQRLGTAYHFRAWRNDRSSATAAYFYARALLNRRGVLTAWEFVRSIEDRETGTPRERAEWWAMRAHLLTQFRDFDAAGEWLATAIDLDPENYWLYVSQAWWLEEQDLYVEAIAAAESALRLKPYDGAATTTIARMSILLEREDDALALLTTAAEQSECSTVVHCLADLQTDLGDYVGAQQSYHRYAEISPLLETDGRQWLSARQSDLAYYLGDFTTASQLAAQVESGSYQKIAERLQATPLVGKRVVLPVGFVRQHHVTCAPATIATLTRFWDRPVEHHQIAAEICYDGTSNYNQRLWAEQNGWIAREFTLTWESAIAAIDRGIPFTLSTTEVTSAHLQAVIGYDSYLQQFLIRDPYYRAIGKMWAVEALEHYALFGPMGMILVPSDRADLLVGLELPDADLYDRSYALQDALEHHRRELAIDIHQQMVEIAPQHRLTLYAERAIGVYDRNETQILAVTEKLLIQFPDRPNLIVDKLRCLKELSRSSERLELLETVCDRPHAHPIFWQYYAQELSEDGRTAEMTIGLLHRVIHYLPTNAENYYLLANILWIRREFALAYELYRFATCLNDKYAKYAKAYFFTAQHRKQTEIALKLIERRCERYGSKSEEPVLTLFWAYCQLNRQLDAFELLDRACREQPDRGDLLIGAASAYIEYGKYQQAEDLLDRTRDRVARTTWLRLAAELTWNQGDLATSLTHWQTILAHDPLAFDAIQAVANLLAETQNSAAAIAFLAAACERFPHSYHLHQLWSKWLEPEDLAAAERVLWLLTEIDSKDAWTRRQLAYILGKQRKFDIAFTELALARQLDPHSPTERTIHGDLCERKGDLTGAKAAYREAIQLSIDSDGAISSLWNLCCSLEERQAALTFVFEELTQQVTFGDGIIVYQDLAAKTLPPLTVLEQVREAWVHRSDLWQSWSVVIHQLLQLDRLEEALELAETYTDRFPLLPKAWVDLSTVHCQRENNDSEAIALQRALEINPTWNIPIGRLTRLYERTDRDNLAKQLLETAIAREPREFSYHCYLAEILWRTGYRQGALNQLKTLIQTTTNGYSYSWAWDKLREWSIEHQQPEFAERLALQLTETRGSQPISWYILAQTLSRDKDLGECLQALDRAIALDPYYIDAYDLKARWLTHSEAYAAALATCHTPAWKDDERPISLRARAVWVEQQWGKHQEAIDRLKELIAIEPGFEWAWMQLAQYYDRLDDLDNYLPAAQRLIEIEPQDSLNWGYYGDALNRTGDRVAARAAWERAITISPSYEYAGLSLFQLHWQAEDFAAAAAVLDRTRSHVPPLAYLPNEIRLAIHHQDRSAAETALSELCLCETETGEELAMAVDFLHKAGWDRTSEGVLYDRLQAQEIGIWVQYFWLETAVRLGEWRKCERYVISQDFRSDRGQHAVKVYLRNLGRDRQKPALLEFVRNYRRVLHPEIGLWGQVGYALRLVQANREAIYFLEDWQTRPTAEPWMLGNLIEALQADNKDTLATQVGHYALNLANQNGRDSIISWLAFYYARVDNIELATKFLNSIESNDRHPEYLSLDEMTRAIIAAKSTMGDRHVKLKIIKDRLSAVKITYPELNTDIPFYRAYFITLDLVTNTTFSFSLFEIMLYEAWHYLKAKFIFASKVCK
jgi:cellulose synthase operon protein C